MEHTDKLFGHRNLPSIIAQMITGKRIKATGVRTSDDDCINSDFFFKMLAKRNMKVVKRSA